MRSTNWTPKQKHLIEILADPSAPDNLAGIAAELGIKMSTLTKWMRNSALKVEVESTVRTLTNLRLAKVWDGILAKAERGDVQAARLIFQLRGDLSDKSKEGLAAPPPVVNIKICRIGGPSDGDD